MRRDLRPAGFLSARGNRSSAWAHTRNQPRACETGQRNKHGARLARRRRAAGRLKRPFGPQTAGWQGKRPKSQRSRAQLFGRFCALGNVWPHILHIHGSLARAFVRQISFWPQGTGVRLFPRPGKQEPGEGHTPGINHVRARLGAYTNPVRDLPAAGVRTAAAQKAASRVTSLPAQTALRRDGACANCPAQPRELPGAAARIARRRRANCSPQARAFSPPGKTEARRGPAPRNNRVRARLSEETNTVRDLLTAGVRRRLRRRARRLSGRKSPPRCAPG